MLLHEYASKRNASFPDVRMVTNTGAALKPAHIGQMKVLFPQAQIFSMYGLTECKRCTYLPPEDIDSKPIPTPEKAVRAGKAGGKILPPIAAAAASTCSGRTGRAMALMSSGVRIGNLPSGWTPIQAPCEPCLFC